MKEIPWIRAGVSGKAPLWGFKDGIQVDPG